MDVRRPLQPRKGRTAALLTGIGACAVFLVSAATVHGQRYSRNDNDSGSRWSGGRAHSATSAGNRSGRYQGASNAPTGSSLGARSYPRANSSGSGASAYTPRSGINTRAAVASPRIASPSRAYTPRSSASAAGPSTSQFRGLTRNPPSSPAISSGTMGRTRSSAGTPAWQAPSVSGRTSAANAAPPVNRPSLGDIQRRIPALPVAQTGAAGQRVANDPPRSGGRAGATTRQGAGSDDPPRSGRSAGPTTTRQGSGSTAFSDLRKRMPDSAPAKIESPLSSERTKDIGQRGKPTDLGRRIPDAAGAKAAGPVTARKGGPGDAGQRGPGAKPGAIKTPADRPNISDLRKRIPDVSSGRTKSADGRGRPGGDVSTLPGKGPATPAKFPEMQKRAGGGPRTPDGLKPGIKINAPSVAGVGRGRPGSEPLGPSRFPDRVKKGDFDALARGAVGQKHKLADQYRLAQQGDVARRMALHRPGNSVVNVTNITNVTKVTNVFGAHHFHHHPDFHHRGWVSPIYHRHSFEYRSWFGPAWYPRLWWYPRWTPWVHWSWYHHSHPWWDPRPIWCRPVRYAVVVQPWVAWDVPVWTPLPEVPAGTWVEVQRPVVAEEQFDLQVLAVRFVDPGHPDEKIGPRYRVWLRNNSQKAITQPFDVRLFATPGEQVVQNAPQAAVRVTAIEAGDTQSIDIRLPFQGTDAAPGAGDKPPFQFLHAMADANREIRDVNLANNGARVPIAEALPVDPAAFETDPKTVAAGGELVIAGEGFGPEPGKVVVHLGNIEMEAEVLGWYDLGVRLKMPDLPLAEATKADLVVIRGDGAAANPVNISVNPPQRNAPQGDVPAPPLPQINAPK